MSKPFLGWTLKVYRQHHPQFLPWVCTARLETKDKILLLNEEGRTEQEAVEKMQERLTRKDTP